MESPYLHQNVTFLLLNLALRAQGILTGIINTWGESEGHCWARVSTKVSKLQTFLGMLVYFQAFIPYFAEWMGPLFDNLQKGVPWRWDKEHEYAWTSGKKALQQAPVLAHTMEGLLYHLYTDASDSACGCSLQKIQKTNIQDLKGTKTYPLLKKAWEEEQPIPQLYTKINSKINDQEYSQQWGLNFKETECYNLFIFFT